MFKSIKKILSACTLVLIAASLVLTGCCKKGCKQKKDTTCIRSCKHIKDRQPKVKVPKRKKCPECCCYECVCHDKHDHYAK